MDQSGLPCLRPRPGLDRITAQGGSISKKYFGPYTMAKHAIEALAVALHEEVTPFGVQVSAVQPGGVRPKDRSRRTRATGPSRSPTAGLLHRIWWLMRCSTPCSMIGPGAGIWSERAGREVEPFPPAVK